MSERRSLAKRIADDGLTMADVQFTGQNFMLCTVRGFDRELVTTFSTSRPGHVTVAELLTCLLSDAAIYTQADSFEDWCCELGYEPADNNSAGTWELVKQQTADLEDFLGEHYDDYLWHTS